MAIKNIIFDLGGVLLNIDFNKTQKAFADLGVTNFIDLYTQFHSTPLFVDYETGKISDEKFIEGIRSSAGIPLSDENVISAWNALLLDFPIERLKLLEKLKTKYRLFLLSNTNALHHAVFQKTVLDLSGKAFDDYFEKAYYSHSMGMRKPGVEIYEWVLKQNNLSAQETLFIDDTLINIEGAKKAGLQAIHLQSPMTILELSL
ncbi:MAG TPA: HAD family phosphatase [Chitinophagaceae bacterium]